MGVSAELVTGELEDGQEILNSNQPTKQWPGFAFSGMDNIKLITLWAIVETDSPDSRFEERLDEVQSLKKSKDGPWVDVIPIAMRDFLAQVSALEEEEIQALASKWGDTEEFKGWDEADVLDLLHEVANLADTAKLEDKTLFLWYSL